MWPNERLMNLFGIEIPIIQAPMAGTAFSDMVVAVSEAGGLGSLACALLNVEQTRRELEAIRRGTSRPINVNFFCHQQPRGDEGREMKWRRRLEAYYVQMGLDLDAAVLSSNRAPFDDKMCDLAHARGRTNVRCRAGVSAGCHGCSAASREIRNDRIG